MRDPAGRLVMEAGRVVRYLNEPLTEGHFLNSALARKWVERGDLVSYEITEPAVVVSKRLPFVTHPYEWCDSQLFRAGQLTLKLQREAVAAGYDLKDASAWNVIFDGTRPVFCDLLSFEPLREKKWWAAGQFARHFIFPLLLAQRRGLHGHECFAQWRDGVPADVARQLIGPMRYLTRYWPLMAGGGTTQIPPSEIAVADLDSVRSFRDRLQASLEWMFAGVATGEKRVQSIWGDYVEQREHYSSLDLKSKQEIVSEWLEECRSSWVLDLGCNSGEFSRLAQQTGAQVIALDGDPGAIERMLVDAVPGIHPVLATLDDVPGGRGWAGAEFPGLATRLKERAELVMMLALTHHLAIGCAVPLKAIAQFAAGVTRRWLVVELLSTEDPQVRKILLQRQRLPADFEMSKQRDAFLDAGFRIVSERPLPSGQRTLCLMERA